MICATTWPWAYDLASVAGYLILRRPPKRQPPTKISSPGSRAYLQEFLYHSRRTLDGKLPKRKHVRKLLRRRRPSGPEWKENRPRSPSSSPPAIFRMMQYVIDVGWDIFGECAPHGLYRCGGGRGSNMYHVYEWFAGDGGFGSSWAYSAGLMSRNESLWRVEFDSPRKSNGDSTHSIRQSSRTTCFDSFDSQHRPK